MFGQEQILRGPKRLAAWIAAIALSYATVGAIALGIYQLLP
jgi:hypothetical protein